MRRCSTSELSSARANTVPGPRHTPRQRRAHRMGLANPCRCGPFERCSALAPPTFYRKRQSVCDCIRLPPVPKHPGTAHPCAFAVFPCLGPAMPGCFGSAMQSRCDRVVDPFANAENETPPGAGPEGVRVASGDRGDRSPRWREISRWWWCRRYSAVRAGECRAIRTRAGPHRAWATACWLRWGRRASWDDRVR